MTTVDSSPTPGSPRVVDRRHLWIGCTVFALICVAITAVATPVAAQDGTNETTTSVEAPDQSEYGDLLAGMEGNGTTSDPYVITNVSELQAMEADLDAHYELGNDIVALETSEWNSGKGFDPISEFGGKFNGNGYTVNGLRITRTTEYNGLFATVSGTGTVTNISLVDLKISGGDVTGGIAGSNRGTIKQVKVVGTVSDNNNHVRIGGITGGNYGLVTTSAANVNVEGTNYVGGITGDNGLRTGTIQKSWARGSVSGGGWIGGIVGEGGGNIDESYAAAEVSSYCCYDGGVVGTTSRPAAVTNHTYWDTTSSGQSSSGGNAIGLEKVEMTGQAARTNMTGLEFGEVWQIQPDNYPELIALEEAGDTADDQDTSPTINASRSSITPTTTATGESQEYTVRVTVENTSLTNEDGDVTVSFEGFDLEVDDDSMEGPEEDVRVDYTEANVSNGTLSVSTTVTGVAPTTPGQYPVVVTDVEANRTGGADEYLIEDSNVTIATISVVETEEVNVDPDDLKGSGTEADPYVITNASELQAIEDAPSAHYELGNDVDASSTRTWNPASVEYDDVGEFGDSESGDIDPSDRYVKLDYEPAGTPADITIKIQGGATLDSGGKEFDIVDGDTLDFGDSIADSYDELDAEDEANLVFVYSYYKGFDGIGYFDGTFDGQEHTIDGLYINRILEGGTEYTAVFDKSGSGGTIRNVRFTNTTVRSSGQTAGLVGSLSTGTLRNIHVDANVSSEELTGYTSRYTGGVVARVFDYDYDDGSIAIANVSSSGKASGPDAVGGIVGTHREGAVVRAQSNMTVSGGERIGGLVGEFDYNGKSEIVDSKATGNVSGNRRVGGLVGIGGQSGTYINNSFATGRIDESGFRGGGVLGYKRNTVVVDSYWDINTTGKKTSTGSATGLTTDQMTGEAARTNMSGLNFNETWTTTQRYPELMALSDSDSPSFSVDINRNETTEAVAEGRNLTAIVNVTNDGETRGSQDIELLINDTIVETRENVTLNGGSTRRLNFTVLVGESGERTVTVRSSAAVDTQTVTIQSPPASVRFENRSLQNGPSTVIVEEAQFGNQSVPGEPFVVVLHETDSDGTIGTKIGESDVLNGGIHQNVSVDLNPTVDSDDDVTELTENRSLVAMLHRADITDGDGINHGQPVSRDGSPVTDGAQVTISTGSIAVPFEATFDNDLNGWTVNQRFRTGDKREPGAGNFDQDMLTAGDGGYSIE